MSYEADREPWVYREGRRAIAGPAFARDVAAALARPSTSALVACGMLEAALADADRASSTVREAAVLATDAVAEHLAGVARGGRVDEAAAALLSATTPETIVVSTPEGFAYYALDPLAYARATEKIVGDQILVVGIRSIGTTLSAVTRAAFLRRGARALRFTVRPSGPPYERRLELDGRERDLVGQANAAVVVVDEGPGLSGSSFLATAEAIAREGVPPARIWLVTSHAPDLSRLRARDARSRWERFRTVTIESWGPPGLDLSAGAWRRRAFAHEAAWPAAFASAERVKRLTPDGRLVKFEGIGPSGDAARGRATALAAEGLAPAPRDEGEGYLSYPWRGRPLRRGEIEVMSVASYLARRATLFAVDGAAEDLGPVVAKNVLAVTGRAIDPPELPVVRPCVVDGRLAPHEWVRDGERVLKVDGIAHGDDHVFPGPTDIAWDLAGAVLESGVDRDALLDAYARASGDDARRRFDAWMLAYASFRAGLSLLALSTTNDPGERVRLARDFARYRDVTVASSSPRGHHHT